MSSSQSFGQGSPKSFHAYPRVGDFDLESGNPRKPRKPKNPVHDPLRMIKSFGNQIHHLYKMHPAVVFLVSLSFGITILIVLSVYESRFRMSFRKGSYTGLGSDVYPYKNLHNLVMVAGHSIYTSNDCGKFEDESSWVLEPYQKNPGQAATFVEHIKAGVEITSKDDGALLVFSGGETRKDAGPRSEAQSYWNVADSESWFGNKDTVRSRTLTEENARDSFENLLFSVCRFRELTGSYPQNITVVETYAAGKHPSGLRDLRHVYIQVVSYDFKQERFSHLHRSAIGFPESRFFFYGTPPPPASREGAMHGEAIARAQFQLDPYGCSGTLHRKRLKRDPFHRHVPYPSGCPELKDLFNYCGPAPYPGILPW